MRKIAGSRDQTRLAGLHIDLRQLVTSGCGIASPVERGSHRRERKIHIVQGLGVADEQIPARHEILESLPRICSWVGRSK